MNPFLMAKNSATWAVVGGGNRFQLGWPHPGPPPQWFPVELSGVDLLVLASQFAQGAGAAFNPDVREALQGAAAKLAGVGVSKMQEQ